MDELKRLLLAWANGEDCWFAIHDVLCDLGCSDVAEMHQRCDDGGRKICDLYFLASGRQARFNARQFTSLEEYLEVGG